MIFNSNGCFCALLNFNTDFTTHRNKFGQNPSNKKTHLKKNNNFLKVLSFCLVLGTTKFGTMRCEFCIKLNKLYYLYTHTLTG